MDAKLLNHLLTLAAKTGDRLIVVDPATPNPFVLMGLAQYESLRGIASERAAESVPPTAMSADASVAAMVVQESDGPYVPVDLGMMARRAEGGASEPQYASEPAVAALPDDERFYVEPL